MGTLFADIPSNDSMHESGMVSTISFFNYTSPLNASLENLKGMRFPITSSNTTPHAYMHYGSWKCLAACQQANCVRATCNYYLLQSRVKAAKKVTAVSGRVLGSNNLLVQTQMKVCKLISSLQKNPCMSNTQILRNSSRLSYRSPKNF